LEQPRRRNTTDIGLFFWTVRYQAANLYQ